MLINQAGSIVFTTLSSDQQTNKAKVEMVGPNKPSLYSLRRTHTLNSVSPLFFRVVNSLKNCHHADSKPETTYQWQETLQKVWCETFDRKR
jgi:hypothetical protein